MNFSQLGFGLFSLKIYGIILSIIFTILIWKYYKELQKQKFPINFFIHHFWKWVLISFLGGRLVELIINPEIILNHGLLSFFIFWEGGGIHFLSFCATFLFLLHRETKNTQFSFSRWLDVGIPFIAQGILFEDIISFFTGNIYGIQTNLPWGIQYETFSVDIVDPVHPVSLYAFIFHLGLYFWIKKNAKLYAKVPGRLFRVFALGFLTIDFFTLFLRGDIKNSVLETFKLDQILIVGIIIGILIYLNKIQKRNIKQRVS